MVTLEKDLLFPRPQTCHVFAQKHTDKVILCSIVCCGETRTPAKDLTMRAAENMWQQLSTVVCCKAVKNTSGICISSYENMSKVQQEKSAKQSIDHQHINWYEENFTLRRNLSPHPLWTSLGVEIGQEAIPSPPRVCRAGEGAGKPFTTWVVSPAPFLRQARRQRWGLSDPWAQLRPWMGYPSSQGAIKLESTLKT